MECQISEQMLWSLTCGLTLVACSQWWMGGTSWRRGSLGEGMLYFDVIHPVTLSSQSDAR